MKALQRDGEIIPEPWDEWTIEHLEWLTAPRPNGDGYTIIENYQPKADELSNYRRFSNLFLPNCLHPVNNLP